MRRLGVLVVVGVLAFPATALASDLDGLLQRSHEASYSAEQIISCSTPEGVTDAVVSLSQTAGDLHVAAPVSSDVEVVSGFGGWTLSHGGAVVASAELEASADSVESRYEVDEGIPAAFLGRKATLFRMRDGDLLRAELIFDDQIGALLKAVTYGSDGQVYCERRFIAFDPTPPSSKTVPTPPPTVAQIVDVDSRLPEQLGSFTRLDLYSDAEGFVFAYYSDGFFSFAVFETPTIVALGDASELTTDSGRYGFSYTPGQVTYVWETPDGGMALIGDLPPDMHESVLSELPKPGRRGWWNRLWRSLFG